MKPLVRAMKTRICGETFVASETKDRRVTDERGKETRACLPGKSFLKRPSTGRTAEIAFAQGGRQIHCCGFQRVPKLPLFIDFDDQGVVGGC